MYDYKHDALICGVPYKLSILIREYEFAEGYQYCLDPPKKNEGLLFLFPKEKKHCLHMRNVFFDIKVLCFNSKKELVGRFIMPAQSKKIFKTPKCKYVIETCC